MDLTNLKWAKCVTPNNREWAYSHQEIDKNSNIFNLHWKLKYQENAEEAKEKDLIVLIQKGKVTHLVKLLDTYAKNDDYNNDEWIYRLVKVIWMADVWSEPPHQTKVFGCELSLFNGKVKKLKDITALNEKWNLDNGMTNFYKYVEKQLSLG